MTAYHLALNEGERTTASGVAALIVALAPAATLALSLAVGLESLRSAPHRGHRARVRRRGRGRRARLGEHFSLHGLRGPLLVLVAPLTFAVYNVLYKPLLGRYDLPALTAAGGLTGSLLFLPFENTGAIDRFGALAAGSWIALAALGLGATLGGYVTWSIALRSLEPSRAMSYLYCVPPLAVAIGALFLDEPVTLWLLAGGALVIGGVAVAQRGPARKRGCRRALASTAPRGNHGTLRKRLMLAGGVATLALLALPTLVSANPGTGPELVQRSGRLVVVHTDRYDGSSTQQWRLVAGATSLPVRAPADVWIDPGTRVRLEGTMHDGTLVVADSLTAVVRTGLSPLQAAARPPRRRRPSRSRRSSSSASRTGRPGRRRTPRTSRPGASSRHSARGDALAERLLHGADLRPDRVRGTGLWTGDDPGQSRRELQRPERAALHLAERGGGRGRGRRCVVPAHRDRAARGRERLRAARRGRRR